MYRVYHILLCRDLDHGGVGRFGVGLPSEVRRPHQGVVGEHDGCVPRQLAGEVGKAREVDAVGVAGIALKAVVVKFIVPAPVALPGVGKGRDQAGDQE